MTTVPDPAPLELLRALLRFDTTNPPGNEAEAIGYLRAVLDAAGIPTCILARSDARPNLIARLPGRGDAPPLLLHSHVDVVTTADQQWTHPPFAAVIADGCVWGRGTIDDKGGVAMMVSAVLRARAEGVAPAGDILLAVVCDEEADGGYGTRYLVEHHREQFEGVRYALGEGGGPAGYLAGRKFYPIMVAEKQICSLCATVHGPSGTGSVPVRDGAMARLGRMLVTLDRRRLPVHVTPPARQMIRAVSRALGFPKGTILGQLLNPRLTDRVLDLLGEQACQIDPLLHNTAAPTIVQGGRQINVLPSEVTLQLDGRLLPGLSPGEMVTELRDLLGPDVDLQVTRHEPGPGQTDMKLYPLLADVLRQADPEGTPIPYMLTGVTDGRYLARLGIQTYGFQPMNLPAGLVGTYHAADERIPVEAAQFGADAILAVLRRYGQGF